MLNEKLISAGKVLNQITYEKYRNNYNTYRTVIARALRIGQRDIKVQSLMPGVPAESLTFYLHKDYLSSSYISYLSQGFGATCVVEDKVNNAIHIAYDNCQLNLVLVGKDYTTLENFVFYHSFGEMGEVIGAIAKRMGMKYTDEGLFFPVNLQGKHLRDVKITCNWYEIVGILGLPYLYIDSAANLDLEVFWNSISRSRFFSKDAFPTPQEGEVITSPMLDFIKQKVVMINPADMYVYTTGKTPWLAGIKKSYPTVLDRVRTVIRDFIRADTLQNKFPDSLISEASGVTDLAEVLNLRNKIKSSFVSLNSYEDFILSSSFDTIKNKVVSVTQVSSGDQITTVPNLEVKNRKPKRLCDFKLPHDVKDYQIVKLGTFSVKVLGVSKANNRAEVVVQDCDVEEYAYLINGHYTFIHLEDPPSVQSK